MESLDHKRAVTYADTDFKGMFKRKLNKKSGRPELQIRGRGMASKFLRVPTKTCTNVVGH